MNKINVNMNNCFNHPERKSFSICHGCKREFCESCLDEGKEYYYCKNAECQKLLSAELETIKRPENMICPNCGNKVELTEEEKTKG